MAGNRERIPGGIDPDPAGGDPTLDTTDCGDNGVDCHTIPGPDPCADCKQCNVGHDALIATAEAIRDGAKAQAAQDLQDDLAAADAAFNDAVSAAEASRGIAIAASTVALATAMLGCAVTGFFTILIGPGAAVACGIIAIIGSATALIIIQANFNNAVSSAAETRDAAKDAARQREQQACDAAEQQFDVLKAIADAAFDACRDLFNCQALECP